MTGGVLVHIRISNLFLKLHLFLEDLLGKESGDTLHLIYLAVY